MENQKELQHFILTRFNLLLWQKDKGGCKVRTKEWLEHRCLLFERYCLPSIKAQTCQDFEWIVLFDSSTPERFKERIAGYQRECKQLIPVYVKPEKGWNYADIFRDEVRSKMKGGRCGRVLTTYLDNDDALNDRFVEDLQKRAALLSDGTFIYYNDGYQFYTDYCYLMRIFYPRNHFVSVVESGDTATVKTIYGYGSHYYIDKIDGAKIERVKGEPMWCEVVHEKNMANDPYFLNAKMVRDSDVLKRNFGLDETVRYGAGIYMCRFLPRYVRTFIRRCKYFVTGKRWG